MAGRSGWKNESRRHSLARKGIKTVSPRSMGIARDREIERFDMSVFEEQKELAIIDELYQRLIK